jgi:predicted kinase
MAAAGGAELGELRCVAPQGVADQRIVDRLAHSVDASDADSAIAHRMALAADPWPEASQVDTSSSVAETRDLAAAVLGVELASRPG